MTYGDNLNKGDDEDASPGNQDAWDKENPNLGNGNEIKSNDNKNTTKKKKKKTLKKIPKAKKAREKQKKKKKASNS